MHPELLFFCDVVVGIVQVAESLFVPGLQGVVLLLEVLKDVAYAKSRPACFLAVCRADTLAGRADLVLSFGCLEGTVQNPVCGQDEMCPFADVQTALEVVASFFEFTGFLHEEVWSNDTAVTDDVELAFIEDAAGNAAEHKLLSFEDDGVSSVWPACEAGYYIIIRGEHIHYLSFSFVAEDDAEQGIYFTFCHSCFYPV